MGSTVWSSSTLGMHWCYKAGTPHYILHSQAHFHRSYGGLECHPRTGPCTVPMVPSLSRTRVVGRANAHCSIFPPGFDPHTHGLHAWGWGCCRSVAAPGSQCHRWYCRATRRSRESSLHSWNSWRSPFWVPRTAIHHTVELGCHRSGTGRGRIPQQGHPCVYRVSKETKGQSSHPQ